VSWRVGGAFAAPFTAAAQQRPWFGPGRDGVLGGSWVLAWTSRDGRFFFVRSTEGGRFFGGRRSFAGVLRSDD